MKKLIVFVVGLCLAVGLYAQTIDSKVGYTNGITWGMKKNDVNKKLPVGKKLQKLDKSKFSDMYKEYGNANVDIYTTSSDDKALDRPFVWMFFVDDKLFGVSEELKATESTEQKLKARYANLEKFSSKDRVMYSDRTVASDGYIMQSIIITIFEDGVASVHMIDWEIYKKTTTVKIAEYDTSVLSIVYKLGDLAKKLVQSSTSKSTYAFIALTSDDGNMLVENYVTDALTEAMFETGKIKIVERASIEKIMSEQKFQSSALVNENTAVEIGNLSGANYVCYGTVKDLGNQISLNVKVVEVSTAELCAMGRETVDKDKYLKGVGFEKRKMSGNGTASANGGSGGSATSETKQEAAVKKVANNQWKVEEVRNDFDDCTVYTFTVSTPDNQRLLVGLKKKDNPIYSSAYCGVVGIGSEIEFKDMSGNIIKKQFKSGWGVYNKWGDGYIHVWYLNGNDGNKYVCTQIEDSSQKKATKWLFDLCLNNDTVITRSNDNAITGNHSDTFVCRFQTAGLEEKLAEYGLTPQDFYDAYKNDEF